MQDQILQLLKGVSIGPALILLLAENFGLFALSVAAGVWMVRRFEKRRVCEAPEPLSGRELALALSTVLLNTGITLAGLWLWRAGIIQFRTDTGVWAWVDVVVLLLGMDFAMYVLHRMAHLPSLFPLLHRTHHGYNRPRPLSLFVLNPAETLAFGGLWLVVISLWDVSWLGMAMYLALNLAFGTIGHLGVEPLPSGWTRVPILGHVTGGTFHAQHHNDLKHNFGFYTTIWDRVFGTLSPGYADSFGRIPVAEH